LSEEDEDNSLLRRLRLSCFALMSVTVLALADPFSSCVVTPSASLESVEIKALATALGVAAALVLGLINPPSAS
jgi:hypothetical protein